jgi:hypothetical protein
MKNLTMRMMIAAAALAVAAGSASAQTYKAEIPMPFRVADKVMAPGSYRFVVGNSSGHAIVSVRSLDTDSAALVVSAPGSDAPKAWLQAGTPKVSFDCLGSTCTLRQLWNGRDSFTYAFPSAERPTIDAQRVTVVTLALIKAR